MVVRVRRVLRRVGLLDGVYVVMSDCRMGWIGLVRGLIGGGRTCLLPLWRVFVCRVFVGGIGEKGGIRRKDGWMLDC